MVLPKDQDVDRSVAALGRNLRSMSAGVFGSALLQYGLYFWIARYLGTASYGGFALAMTVAVLAAPLCDLGMATSLVRAASRDPAALPGVLGAGLVWRLLLALPVAAGVALLCSSSKFPAETFWLVWPLLLAAYLDGFGTFGSAVFQAWEDMRLSAGYMILRNVLRCAAFGLALILHCDARALALLVALSALLAAAPLWRLILRRVRPHCRRAELWPVLRTAFPFGVAVISVMLHTQVDVIMLGWFCPATEVGIYHAGVRFFVLALLIPQVVAMAVAPLDYKVGLRSREGIGQICRAKTVALGLIGLGLASVMVVAGRELVAAVLGSGYARSAAIVMAMAPAVFVKFISSPLGDALAAVDRQRVLGLGCGLGLLVNVLANSLLIPRLGALGAALATCASELFYLLFLAVNVGAAGVRLDWQRLFAQPLIAVAVMAVLWHGASLLPFEMPSLLALPAGVAVYLMLAVRRPVAELAHLLRRLAGNRLARRQPRAASGCAGAATPH